MWPLLFGWLSLTPLDNYHFISRPEPVQRLVSQFDPPLGYERVSVASGSFGEWLRDLPLSEDSTVRSYLGNSIAAPVAAVVELDLGRGNLQQCADSILRLYAEYRWSVDKGQGLGFHFSSGDRSDWSKWRTGERFSVRGSKVKRIQNRAVSNTHSHLLAQVGEPLAGAWPRGATRRHTPP